MSVALPALTAVLALSMAIALLDQWRDRRQPFQLVWAIGMAFFGIASGCEALAAAGGWNEALYRTWYLTGAVLTAGWLGLGTILLLAKTRFGYAIALSLFLAGVFTILTQRRYDYPDAGSTPILYFIGAGLLALAVAVETYFQNERWPAFVAIGVGRGERPRALPDDHGPARRAVRARPGHRPADRRPLPRARCGC